MECSRGRRRWSGRSMLKLAALCFAMAIWLCCVWSCDCSGSGSGCRGGAVLLRSDIWRRTASSCANQGCSRGGQWRRLLAEGPGSYPPRCTSKCGDCSPCYPVHVAVPPGVPVTTEYYPEAWRCKCGNRLYMP
ncbi:EPIDERMAL PATTERNING FACTOR-like protein 8 [Phragmites australis]|uniref:EPIDERMAL PATTERNING FACTOR-like protein 8 n=1 Tax=Phragmites australis TaxID=29695 RepID=UPI002D78BD08|nr:EPIDERMAL PATTERNING FACTOR-like protein 8 [Phragmites australis]